MVDFTPEQTCSSSDDQSSHTKIKVAIFLGNEEGCLTVKNEEISTTAAVIKRAVGPSGPNVVYFDNLVAALKEKNLSVDEYLSELELRVHQDDDPRKKLRLEKAEKLHQELCSQNVH